LKTGGRLPVYETRFTVAIILYFSCNPTSLGCECGDPGHASKYVERAAVVFVGKVVFTDDDGTGQFFQHTLVHFEVEESFKGLQPGVNDVWIDPGSYTTCYAEHKVGERHLLFADGGGQLPKDAAAMSTANKQCRTKPLPAAIDPQSVPKFYVAAECSGTRPIVKKAESQMAREINWLRNYRKKMEKATN
jgi:hypothetical protein